MTELRLCSSVGHLVFIWHGALSLGALALRSFFPRTLERDTGVTVRVCSHLPWEAPPFPEVQSTWAPRCPPACLPQEALVPHRCLSQMWSLLEESERCCVVFTADHTPSCLSCCRSLLPCPEQTDSPGVEAQVSVTAWPGAGQGVSKVCVCGSLVVSGDNSGDHKALWTSFLHAFTQVVGLLSCPTAL